MPLDGARLRNRAVALIFAAVTSASLLESAWADLPLAEPFEVGMDRERLSLIDAAVQAAMDAERAADRLPGAVVLVARRGKVVYRRAFGRRALIPEPEAMTVDSIFDLASLTKPVATATSILILIDQGRLRLDDELGLLLPALAARGKGAITVEQLLRHRSGLIADNPLADYAAGPDMAWRRIGELELVAKPGEKFIYSDVNFIILGRIVEEYGAQLDPFAARHVFAPLGMRDTAFFPRHTAIDPKMHPRIVPTEQDASGQMLRGVVHDPRARLLGGVAGHAGLFGTADDLAVFCQMLLDGGKTREGRRILSSELTRQMLDSGETPAGQRRGLGWDIDTPYSSPRGGRFGPTSFGHTGFTGTSVWIDPESQILVIILTSRVHPDGKGSSVLGLRRNVATLAAKAIASTTGGERDFKALPPIEARP